MTIKDLESQTTVTFDCLQHRLAWLHSFDGFQSQVRDSYAGKFSEGQLFAELLRLCSSGGNTETCMRRHCEQDASKGDTRIHSIGFSQLTCAVL